MTLTKFKANLILSDIAVLAYLAFTFVYLIIFSNKFDGVWIHLVIRLLFFGLIFILVTFHKPNSSILLHMLRYFYPLLLMTYLYGETDFMNNAIFENLDTIFAGIDQKIFGFQPSIEFSKRFPFIWFNELMNFGYFCYYFLTFLVSLVIYWSNRKEFEKSLFVVTFSFFVYYIIFILIPVAGPQFYFQPPDSVLGDAWIFREGVKLVQAIGEKPTAAFPSSHVGMSVMFLFLSYKFARKLFFIILFPIVVLWFSTIYIKAHYFIDVAAGFVSSFIILWLSLKLFNNFHIKK